MRNALRIFFEAKCCVFEYFAVPLHRWKASMYSDMWWFRQQNNTKIQYIN